MFLYSQRDPSYDQLTLGQSSLTICNDGCFLCSLATLYQKSPVDLMKIPGAILPDGELVAAVIAQTCGGSSLPPTTTAPTGWCIAETDAYGPRWPTHFFCTDGIHQIDPLKFPAIVEPLSYHIVNYRPFTNIVLNTTQQIGNAITCISSAWTLLSEAPPSAAVTQAQALLHQANTILRQ